MRESFDQFGDRIAIIHVKDFVVEDNRIKSVLAGQGLLHFGLLRDCIKEHRPLVEVLMEDTQPETVDQGVHFLRGFFPE